MQAARPAPEDEGEAEAVSEVEAEAGAAPKVESKAAATTQDEAEAAVESEIEAASNTSLDVRLKFGCVGFGTVYDRTKNIFSGRWPIWSFQFARILRHRVYIWRQTSIDSVY